eukprot:scaffold1300_cov197-Chaetoceros_neogracile.AAC.8
MFEWLVARKVQLWNLQGCYCGRIWINFIIVAASVVLGLSEFANFGVSKAKIARALWPGQA